MNIINIPIGVYFSIIIFLKKPIGVYEYLPSKEKKNEM